MTDIDTDTARRVLDLPLPDNDAGAATVRDYLVALLTELWREEAGFSGGQPFGNSGWQYDVYEPLRDAGHIPAWRDGYGVGYRQDGSLHPEDMDAADKLILAAIAELGKVRP